MVEKALTFSDEPGKEDAYLHDELIWCDDTPDGKQGITVYRAKGKPKDAIVKTEYSFANENESGTGLYMVIFCEHGVKMVYKRFADYWDKDSKGNVDEIVLTPIKENATRTAALLSGGVDFIAPVPPQDYERLRKNTDVNMVTMTGSRVITFQLNQKKKPEFANLKVRQAVIAAIDNAGIVAKLMKGTATAATQIGRASCRERV